jgi:PAS domain S-box-containing protein
MSNDPKETAGAEIEAGAGVPPWGEATFRSLCEALPVGVLLSDERGKTLYLNPAMEKIAGLDAGSTVERWEEQIDPADRERVVSGWRNLASAPGTFRADFRFHLGAEQRWGTLQVSSMPGPGGTVGGFVSVLEDTTTRFAAEEALRQSEDRFPAIVDSAGVGLGLGTPDGLVVRVNRAYGDFLGYAPHEMAGRHIRDFIDAEHVEQSLKELADLRDGKIARVDLERRYIRRDGTRVWGRTAITRLPGAGLLIAVVQDIDSRRRAEDAVRRLSGRFLHLQDEERRRIARSLHESAAQTVAALSMDLQRMERMGLPALAAETLQDTLALAAQTSREIRTLSPLLHPPLLEEAGLPSSLRWLVQGFSQRSDVKVTLDLADDLGRLSTELEITLFRIVQESLTNVHRHSGSQSASVRLRRTGPDVELEIADQGVGIPEEMLERVQAQLSAAPGVGIAGMRERLSQLGGTLEILPANPGTLVRARIRSETK